MSETVPVDPTAYRFLNEDVRVFLVDGDPWWVLSDVAKILGFRDAANAKRVLRAGQTRYSDLSTPGGVQNALIVNEPGLYRLIMRANAPVAEPFQDWVTTEVLPQIRKTGQYAAQHALPTTFAEALELAARQARALEQSEAARVAAEQAAAELAPAAAEYATWLDTGTTLEVGAAAARLVALGVDTGRTRLYALLREWRWVFQQGQSPQRHAVASGYVEAEAGKPYPGPDGEIRQGDARTRLTAKGLRKVAEYYRVDPDSVLAVEA